MRKILLLYLIIPTFLFALPQQMEFMQKLNSGNPHFEKEFVKIPFHLNGHKIFLKTKINDSKELNFILDTGAITIIDEKIAHELSLENGIALPSPDTLRNTFISKNKVRIILGELYVDEFIPLITDLPNATSSEPSLDGFIGSDFLRFFSLTINYQKQELILTTKKIVPSKPFYKIAMQRYFPLGFPMIEGTINDTHKTQMIIDTGSPFSIVCPLSMIENSNIFANQTVLKSNGTFMKWPSTTAEYNYLSYANVLEFEDFRLNNIPIFFAEIHPPLSSSALIGKDFLHNFITTIDYINNEIALEPLQNENVENLFSLGLGVKMEEDKLIVRGVWQNSPAEKHGIKVNDEIIKINEFQTSELSLEEVNKILKNDKIIEIVLQIKNDKGNHS